MRSLFLLMCLVLPLIVQAEGEKELPKAYRWVDKDGTVHFSSTPPPAGMKSTEIELRQPDTVIHQENRAQMLEQGDRVGDKVDARQEKRQQLLQQIDDAKAMLVQASEALLNGEAPQSGETKRLVGGSTRLTDAYHQRREAEAKRLEQLQQQLDDLYAELNKLR